MRPPDGGLLRLSSPTWSVWCCLSPLIFVLTLAAALAGLWPREGNTLLPDQFSRGGNYYQRPRPVLLGHAQFGGPNAGQRPGVLVLGLPLLAISFWLTLRGSLRGRLLLTGTLGFILYTYITMCFGAAYNKLFLVYVALFSVSLFAFILSMMSFDLKTLPLHFSEKLPRRAIAALLFFAAAFLTLAWLGRIAPTVLQNQIPFLENVTSMFIQAMDLGIIVPMCVLAGSASPTSRAPGATCCRPWGC